MRTQQVRLLACGLAGLLVTTLLFGVATIQANVTITEFTATGSGTEIEVFWQTETELDTLGFFVWRSEVSDPLDMLSEGTSGAIRISNLIPGTGATSPADYTYVDNSAENEIIYYYYLQEVENDGTELFVQGPVSAALTGGNVINTPPTATPVSEATATPAPNTPTPDAPTATPTTAASSDATPTSEPEQVDVTRVITEDATPTAPVVTPTSANGGAGDDNSSAETRPAPVPIATAPQESTQNDTPTQPESEPTATPAVEEEGDETEASDDSADADIIVTDQSDLVNNEAIAEALEENRAVIGDASLNESGRELLATIEAESAQAEDNASSTRTILLTLSAIVLVVVLIAAAAVVVILIRNSAA